MTKNGQIIIPDYEENYTEEERTAYHEAGHVFMYHRAPFTKSISATIIPKADGSEPGRTHAKVYTPYYEAIYSGKKTRSNLHLLDLYVVTFNGGWAAEMVKFWDSDDYAELGAYGDFREAQDLLSKYYTDENNELTRMIIWHRDLAIRLMKNPRNWDIIDAIAEALLQHKTLTHEQIKKVIRETPNKQQIQESRRSKRLKSLRKSLDSL